MKTLPQHPDYLKKVANLKPLAAPFLAKHLSEAAAEIREIVERKFVLNEGRLFELCVFLGLDPVPDESWDILVEIVAAACVVHVSGQHAKSGSEGSEFDPETDGPDYEMAFLLAYMAVMEGKERRAFSEFYGLPEAVDAIENRMRQVHAIESGMKDTPRAKVLNDLQERLSASLRDKRHEDTAALNNAIVLITLAGKG